jgi:ketosteroid isomerase-like protein
MERRQLEERVRSMYAAFAAAEEAAYRAAFAEGIVWHVPGDNPVSGAYRGRSEYFETMPARMAPLDAWTITVRDVFSNQREDAALVAFHLSGSRKGRSVEMDGYHMIRLDQQGRIVEGWGFAEDQDALDAFFSA